MSEWAAGEFRAYWLRELAANLFEAELSLAATLALLEHANRTRCRPPLGRRELLDVADSAAELELQRLTGVAA